MISMLDEDGDGTLDQYTVAAAYNAVGVASRMVIYTSEL